MSISTLSKFYYGHQVDSSNCAIDFDEGGAELTATLDTGEYTLTEYCAEIKSAMEAVGALTYTVSVNRSTRKITIAATGNFKLRITTGSHSGTTAYTMAGFTGADVSGAATYTAGSVSGSVYSPQFKLQDYVSPTENVMPDNSTVVETVAGDVEVVSFSSLDRIEMNIRFCTNIPQPSNGPLVSNPTGLTDVNTFMRYLITKSPVEFIPDVSSPSTFYKVILDSTTADKKGVAYKMKELTDKNIAGYYDTEKLTFRVLT